MIRQKEEQVCFWGTLTRVVILNKHNVNFKIDKWEYNYNTTYVESNAQLKSLGKEVDKVINYYSKQN